ncbi:MAG: hypothetical protein QOI81_1963 [Actinomycetota bacterium]|nr:hypothetical protein [Actinomycetota bacterium]
MIAVLGATLLLSAATPASAGGHSKLLYWAGHTSQAAQIDFSLVRSHHKLRLSGMDFEIALTCDDSTVQYWGVGFGFFPGEPLVNKQLTFSDNDGQMAINMTGDFSRDRATGTLRVTIAALTSDEQAQLCTTGDLTWVAHHQPLPSNRSHSELGSAGRGPGSIVIRGPGMVAHLLQH